MEIYTIKKADPIGEKDEKYGFTIWAEVEETDSPVMFNSHKDPIVTGTQLVAEETESKTSKKGTAYLRLKRVKLSEPKEPSQTETATPATQSQLDRIEKKIDTLLRTANLVEEFSEADIPEDI